ncbi:Phosphoheptose isomerase [Rubrivivax sp. A210]|uniref:D-sedoheptulose-7-phosphate isomerase n=1 Tax=Rubrivivax sp. A210 TaxID=2772301 RepID=UPI001918DDEE|nr:SIS domain-containing protein [Rubrivivax sp. A210]CAD5373656.1 Phosphoheptose isomerase [Rubrivivax sp. A210]
MNKGLFHSAIEEHRSLFEGLHKLQPDVERIAARLAQTLAGGGKLMFCGNGGSAADSQHLAAELTGRLVDDRRPLAGLALSTDSSALTCIGNDYGFDAIFERQVRALGRAGDSLVLISTSGNSANLLRAATAARELGIATLGLLGRDGGLLLALCDDAVVVPSNTTARIQEAHIFIGHCWCALAERALGLAPA